MENLFCCKCATKCVTEYIAGQNRGKCPNCGYIYYRNPFPCVSVIVSDGEKIFLGKRADSSIHSGKWCLPCGYIEYNESFLDAAIREVKEETGLITEPIKIINIVSNQLLSGINSIVIVLISRPLTYELSANDDLVEVNWFNLTQPLPELAFDSDKYIINKCKESLDNRIELSGILLSDRKSYFTLKHKQEDTKWEKH